MIVYVESNYVLEIALGQEQSSAAEDILEAVERGTVDLAIPQFCLSEPYSTLTMRGRERQRLSRMLAEQLQQLARSSPHQLLVQPLRTVPDALVSFEKSEFDRLESTIGRLLSAGSTIALDESSFRSAITFRQTYDLSPQDATIFACVLAQMSARDVSEPKCFLSRNFKDFDDPGIRGELGQHGCEYADSFENALKFVQGGQPPFTTP